MRVLLCNTDIDYRIFDQKPIHFKPVIRLEKKQHEKENIIPLHHIALSLEFQKEKGENDGFDGFTIEFIIRWVCHNSFETAV